MKLFTSSIIKRAFCASRPHTYEIPDEYHNSFYLANASLLQMVNYFIHASYKTLFPELLNKVVTHLNCSSEEAAFKLRTCINTLDKCEATFDLNLPVRRSNGFHSIVRANRTYHAIRFFDKCMGGIRFEPELTRHNCYGFAVQQTYRNALFGINMGGSSGGFRISPYVLDQIEMPELLRLYMSRIPRIKGVSDVVEPDFGSTVSEMDIMKSYEDLAPHVLVMGKSEVKGGYSNHIKSSGKCAVQCIKKFLEHPNIKQKLEITGELNNKTFILHGFGKVGKEVGEQMSKEGAKCIGVREHDCVLYEPSGIHVKALYKHIIKYGTMRSFSPKCREYDLDSIFAQPCDIMVLAAVERTVSCAIAERIQAKAILEVANLAVTPSAHRVLTGKNKLVIPGILAGAGPSLMSYYEYEMGSKDNSLDPKNIQGLFDASLQTAVDDILDIECKLNLKFNYLHAAYIRAVRNLFKRIIHHQLSQEKSNQKLISMQ